MWERASPLPQGVMRRLSRLCALQRLVHHPLRHLHQMHHRPLRRLHHLTRRSRCLHRAVQQLRRMGQGVFEAQVVIQDKDRRIRGGCLEVVVDGTTVEQGVFAEEVGLGLGWVGVTLIMV